MKTDFTRTRKYVYFWAADKARKAVSERFEFKLGLNTISEIKNIIDFQVGVFVFNPIGMELNNE
jgi:hypothetical protein